MRTRLLFATSNKGKEREIRRILGDVPGLELSFLDDHPGARIEPPEENGRSFDENALIKAKYYRSYFPLSFVAGEDSGLCVDYLDGFPGVYSARYKGIADDGDKVKAVLKELEGVPARERKARFTAVIALVKPAGNVEVFRGTVEGAIAKEARGENGFGYDPIFVPEGKRRTFAEMKPEEKDAMSHRNRALEKLREYLVGRPG